MYLLGTVFIVSGIIMAAMAAVSYALVPRGNIAMLAYGRFGTRAALIAVLLVMGLLSYLPPGDPSRRYQGPEGLARALQALARRRTASY